MDSTNHNTDLLENPQQIRRHLEKALVEEETVEVQINERTRVFFTAFLDHPTEMAAGVDDDGKPLPPPKPYEPLSYLRKMDHLVIAPLVPAEDAVILDSTDLTIEGAASVVLELARARSAEGAPAAV